MQCFNSDRDAQTLFVKNVSYNCGEREVRGLFPEAVDVRMPQKSDGYGHRGYVRLKGAPK